jgi:hypothetical protein
MAVTVTATQVDDGSGWSNTPPAGHAGWNNTAGDGDWIPDVAYNRRFLLECKGDAGEVGGIVNWEIYDGTSIPFVDDASALLDNANGAMVNDRASGTIWAWNGTDAYEDTGTGWVSTLRANGPRVVVELPAYLKWGTADSETVDYEIAAYLPGGGKTPAGTVSVTVSNPDVAVLA